MSDKLREEFKKEFDFLYNEFFKIMGMHRHPDERKRLRCLKDFTYKIIESLLCERELRVEVWNSREDCRKELQTANERIKELEEITIICPECNGSGAVPGHDPSCRGECKNCPQPYPCETCLGTGNAKARQINDRLATLTQRVRQLEEAGHTMSARVVGIKPRCIL
jgi:hypothetical protein